MADTIPALPNAAGGKMTDTSAAPQKNVIDTFVGSQAVQHFGRLIGLAVAVTIGVMVALWSSEPNYTPLHNNISGADVGEIAQLLQTNNIEFKLDPVSGVLQVEQSKSAEARMLLASKGLPQSSSVGLEMLMDEQSLGTSQFIEKKRYNHALEEELARSVESIRSIESARVHLALPKHSIFIRNRTKPSASVVTKLFAGRALNKNQVDAIVNMVASSIPMMDASMVTVIDQYGNLLSVDEDTGLTLTTKQFDYAKKIENDYADRIVKLLEPIIGKGKVNTQVSAQLDFANVETTREAYDPERSVLRSEQVSEAETRSFAQAIGIPGALSNQPPGAGTTNPNAAGEDGTGDLPANQNRTATRNFEVDRVLSHTQHSVGTIQRISVAVVIDNKTTIKEDGTIESIPYTDEEIATFSELVKQTIGFTETRGDSINLVNSAFVPNIQEIIEVPLLEELLNTSWLIDLVKQVFGGIGLLIIYLMFGKPLLKSLNPNKTMVDAQGNKIDPVTGELVATTGVVGQAVLPDGVTMNEAGQMIDADGKILNDEEAKQIQEILDDPNNPANLIRKNNVSYEQKIEMARNIVMDDPARVSNVLKNWVGAEE